MFTLAILLLLLVAGVAGAVVALRDTIVDGPVRVPTRRDLLPAEGRGRGRR